MAVNTGGVRGQISSETTQLQRSEGIPPHDPVIVRSSGSFTSAVQYITNISYSCPIISAAPRRQRTESRSDIYYIGVDKQPSSARETSSPAAFDELFKFHFVLSLSDEECLALIYTFVLASVYNVDAGTTTEAVCELQAKTKTPWDSCAPRAPPVRELVPRVQRKLQRHFFQGR
ncbi:DnaJ like subfamily C member 10 [Dissostichus eleginoides]|uniref:DnaJ like subfamily C member 10 n=1 Tax=Dissostichus eleginoides TaxID=100907 RepID=A0AAD9BA17_DISEL|nr:DnaJ like subfamily C member 10 [Dissostichus eleginoides]